MFYRGTAQCMLTLIDGSLTYMRETATHHRHGAVTHHHGEDDHPAYLQRPFLDAQKLMQERIRQAH